MPRLAESIYSKRSEEAKTGCQREPTRALALSSSQRCHLEHLAPSDRCADRTDRSNTAIFIETLRRLTRSPVQRYISGQKKVILNFLYIETALMFLSCHGVQRTRDLTKYERGE